MTTISGVGGVSRRFRSAAGSCRQRRKDDDTCVAGWLPYKRRRDELAGVGGGDH